jgi:hypothetical protein
MAQVQPVLNQLNIVARDFDTTLAFYRRLGVAVPDGFSSPDGIRHAEVTLANGFVLEFDNLALARLTTPRGARRPAAAAHDRILAADA